VPRRDRATCGFRVVHIGVTGMKSSALSCPRALPGGQGRGAAARWAFPLLIRVLGRTGRYGCAAIGCRSRPSGRPNGGRCLPPGKSRDGRAAWRFSYRPCDGLPAGARMPPVFVIRKPAGEAYPCHRPVRPAAPRTTNRVRRGRGRASPPRIDPPAGTRGGRERRTALVATPAASASPVWATTRSAITGECPARRSRAASSCPPPPWPDRAGGRPSAHLRRISRPPSTPRTRGPAGAQAGDPAAHAARWHVRRTFGGMFAQVVGR